MIDWAREYASLDETSNHACEMAEKELNYIYI